MGSVLWLSVVGTLDDGAALVSGGLLFRGRSGVRDVEGVAVSRLEVVALLAVVFSILPWSESEIAGAQSTPYVMACLDLVPTTSCPPRGEAAFTPRTCLDRHVRHFTSP